MRAVVVSIGSELLEGFITDTNATFLAQELAALGIELVGVTQVGDRLSQIVEVFRRAWTDADLIVTTGGIGPTEDDLTREAVAALIGETPGVDPGLLAEIAAFFRARGTEMPNRNQKQAWLIPSAQPLHNPMGTAPGWFVERDGHLIADMPGVPREMFRMWREQVVPRLLPHLDHQVIVSRTLKTIGIGESAAEQEIADLIARGQPIIATYAKDDGVHIRITSAGADDATVTAAVDRAEQEVRAILGRYIYGDVGVSLGSALLEPLVRTGQTLAISEAGSGGRVTSLIAEEPAAIVYYHGGLVRAFEHVAAELGIDAAESDAARRLAALEADAVRERLLADFGLSIVVRLQPGESADRTFGEMAFALSGAGRVWTREHTFRAIPSELRRRAGLWGAEFLRNALIEATAGAGAER